MVSELIGQHATVDGSEPGMSVYRLPARIDYGASPGTMIAHVAHDQHNAAALHNHVRALTAMRRADIAPEWLVTLIAEMTFDGVAEVYETDAGESEPITDGEVLRHAAIRLLATIRARGWRHGDLTGPNIIARDGGRRLVAIDWQEAHRLDEPSPQKQPWTDSQLIMRYLFGTVDASGQMDTPRVARRWSAVLGDLGAVDHRDDRPLPLRGRQFLDLGCYEGDFVALAACEGMRAIGVDRGGFRTGENSIETGLARWWSPQWRATWDAIGGSLQLRQDDLWHRPLAAEVAMCFSTWPYLVRERSWGEAVDWLTRLIDGTEVLYFETQLAGDGPGPVELATDSHVEALLDQCGAREAKPIGTFPVTGRPASRTVWAVR